MIEQSGRALHLSFIECEGRYHEARDKFEKIRGHYSGFFGRLLKRRVGQGELKSLEKCVGTILPLQTQGSVQEQAGRMPGSEDSLHSKIGQLTLQIINYLADFEDSGVTRVG